MMTLAPETLIKRSGNALSTKVNTETILMDIETGAYFTLNPTSSIIWDMLEQPLVLVELKSKILDHFDGIPVTMDEELSAFIQNMAHKKLFFTD